MKKMKIPHNEWKSPTTISRANSHVGHLAKKGQAIGIRQTPTLLQVAVPKENAIYNFHLNKNGFIKKITRF